MLQCSGYTYRVGGHSHDTCSVYCVVYSWTVYCILYTIACTLSVFMRFDGHSTLHVMGAVRSAWPRNFKVWRFSLPKIQITIIIENPVRNDLRLGCAPLGMIARQAIS